MCCLSRALENPREQSMRSRIFSSMLLFVFVVGIQVAGAGPIDTRMAEPLTTKPQAEAPGGESYSSGQVKRIDWDQGKVLIAHGPIENLGMPSMTMLFRVSERSLLQNLNSGDMVRFKAEKTNGTLFVVDIVRQ